jgi:4-hydroxy-2-oxoglutarate aldolase
VTKEACGKPQNTPPSEWSREMAGKITGIMAPITTPFVDEKVAIDRLKENIRKYSKTPLSGFFVLGSNGENKSLTESEKLTILEAVLQERSETQIVMAGTGHESTCHTIAFSKRAADLGVDFVSVLTPSYFKKSLTDEALIGFYRDVAEAVSVPVLIYNAPGFTGVNISPGVIEVLSRHPNILGMKDTSPGGIGGFLAVCEKGFDVLSGTINTLFSGLALGASGGVVSLANAFPQPCCDLFERFGHRDVEGTRDLHYRLYRLNQSVSGSFGVAGVKYAMEVAGYYGGCPRLPLLPLKDSQKETIRKAIAAAGLG